MSDSLFLVDMPPPVHGMSAVNKSMADIVEPRVLLDSAPVGQIGNVKIPNALGKVLSFFSCFLKFLFVGVKGGVVYRSLNGGGGQIFDLVFMFLFRFYRCNVFIHHHSYAYLNKYSYLFRMILFVMPSATHVVLGDEMKSQLCDMYPVEAGQVRVLSNSAFYSNESIVDKFSNNRCGEGEIVIGHLANLSFSKGLVEFLDLCLELSMIEYPYRFVLAGGFSSSREREYFYEFIKKNDINIKWLGPVYGEDKNAFYNEIDIFVFLSKYENEAEPLVLYEAASHGCTVVGSRQGCMESVIGKLGGVSFDRDGAIHKSTSLYIEKTRLSFGDGFFKNSSEKSELFLNLVNKSKISLGELIAELR